MKKMILAVLVTAMMYFVGCSNLGTEVVGVSSEKEKAVMDLSINVMGLGGMAKTLANREDSLFITLGLGTEAATQGTVSEDVVDVSQNQNVNIRYGSLDKPQNYWLSAVRGNKDFAFNMGSVDFFIPETADTFKLTLDCAAEATKLQMSFDFGSVDICTLIVERAVVTTGQPFIYIDTMEILEGQSTCTFESYLWVNDAWTISVKALVRNSSVFYEGSSTTPVLEGGKNYSPPQLTLTGYDGTKAIAMTSITLEAIGDYNQLVVLGKRMTQL